MGFLLLRANLNDVLWTDCLIPSAAFGVQELQYFLERFGIGGIAKESTFAADIDQTFIPQLV
jgi:hypothetical protein